MNRTALLTETDCAPAPPQTITEAFQRVVDTAPQRIALLAGNSSTTYAELAARADEIAANLRQRGVGTGDIVGLFIPRSAEAIAAILGVLKTGAAYLPFDLSYPTNLLRYIFEDSKP